MGMTGPFTVNAPYSALGNQVLCIVPNMVGGQQGVSPQLINAAMLQKSDHFSALSPQQQQAIMAQQLHAMNPGELDGVTVSMSGHFGVFGWKTGINERNFGLK